MAGKLITKELENELMLYDTVRDAVHILNATAKLTYRLYQEGKTPAEIAAAITEKFKLEEDRDVLKDVRRCLAELKEKGLIMNED